MSYIVAYMVQGFGNKLMMFINYIRQFLELKQENPELNKLYILHVVSRHEKSNEKEKFTDIFPKLNDIEWIEFIYSWKEFDTLKKDAIKIFEKLYVFNPDDWIKTKPFVDNYLIVNSKYDYLLDKYDTKKGIALHYRLGDKLEINIKYGEQFLVMNPKYFIDNVNKLTKINRPVYLFSDSPKLAKCALSPYFETIYVVNEDWVETFYLFTKFKRLVLSESTLAICAVNINKNNPVAIIPDYQFVKGKLTNVNWGNKFIYETNRKYKLKPSEYSELSKCV